MQSKVVESEWSIGNAPFLRCCHKPNEGIPLYSTAAASSDSVVRCRVSSSRVQCCVVHAAMGVTASTSLARLRESPALQRFVGTAAVAEGDEFWSQLLSFSYPPPKSA